MEGFVYSVCAEGEQELQSVVENREEGSDNWGDSLFAVVYTYSSRLETLHEHFSG